MGKVQKFSVKLSDTDLEIIPEIKHSPNSKFYC